MIIRLLDFTASAKLVEQRLRLLQTGRVEALGEPVIDGQEEVARFLCLALVALQAGETAATRFGVTTRGS